MKEVIWRIGAPCLACTTLQFEVITIWIAVFYALYDIILNHALLRTEFCQLALVRYATTVVEIQLNFDRAANIFGCGKFCEFCVGSGPASRCSFPLFSSRSSFHSRLFQFYCLNNNALKLKTLKTIHLQWQPDALSYGNNNKAHVALKKTVLLFGRVPLNNCEYVCCIYFRHCIAQRELNPIDVGNPNA